MKNPSKMAKKASSKTKGNIEKNSDRHAPAVVDNSLVSRAVNALLNHHEKTADDKLSLLGNNRPVQVQVTLLRAPEKSNPKPIRILVPHPLFKVNGTSDDALEDPEICLIVKEESKPWCQEMIEQFSDHMGCIKKVLGLQSLRKKHAQFEQRRELLNKYNVFMADDRILPMLTKSLGKDFFKAKKQPIPINLTRKEALPFTIQKALSATYMTLSAGTCVTIKCGHTGMKPEALVENVAEIAKNAVPKIPRKWANVQAISIKTPESVALPVYSKVPSLMNEIDQEMDLNTEEKEKNKVDKQQNPPKKDDAVQKKKTKSPLLQALKKVDIEKKKKRKESSDNDDVKKETPGNKRKKAGESSGKQKAERKDFIAAKTFQGSKTGFVFRMGISGLGYYKDVKPVVDRLAMEAIKRMGKGSAKKGRRSRRSY
ncbi:unnamed protein product [Cylindrotheca closterium]|uniref:Ribosomal protein n=1 Tax=Cylindrotheca closterium TaxID=2856 RepID=A0AAD2CCH0_9STRA|nr:unnamed protein product [Cylindrotheca closterium]